jgi:hypothetical protein
VGHHTNRLSIFATSIFATPMTSGVILGVAFFTERPQELPLAGLRL